MRERGFPGGQDGMRGAQPLRPGTPDIGAPRGPMIEPVPGIPSAPARKDTVSHVMGPQLPSGPAPEVRRPDAAPAPVRMADAADAGTPTPPEGNKPTGETAASGPTEVFSNPTGDKGSETKRVVSADSTPGSDKPVTGKVPQSETGTAGANEPDETPPIDVKETIFAARTGDTQAEERLETYTEGQLTNKFKDMMGEDADVQGMVARAKEKLDEHTYDYPESSIHEKTPSSSEVETEYNAHLTKMARSTYMDHLTDPVEGRIVGREITAELPELDKVVTAKQYPVVRGRIEGKSNEEIASATGLSVDAVKQRLSSARGKIAGAFDLSLLTEFADPNALRQEIVDGRMRGVQVMGRWYTKPEWVPPTVDVSGSDYYSLSRNLPHAAVHAFRQTYPDLIVSGPRRASYVRATHVPILDSFLANVQTPRAPVEPPAPGLTTVFDIANTQSEGNLLYRALRSGGLTGEVWEGRTVFVPRDQAERLLAEYRQREAEGGRK